MSPQTSIAMATSYTMMCKYYELCVPGLETKNPHFLSSLHVIKRDASPAIEPVTSNLSQSTTPSVNQQENKVTSTTHGSQLKLLFKGKKDNKIHVKCSCNDITDGSAIKRKFLIKCNKCHSMVHGKCHNLNAQLFNNSSNHSSKWYCATCTIDIQSEIRKTAMAEDVKRAVQTSPNAPASSSKSSRATQNRKETSKLTSSNSRAKHKASKNSSEKSEGKARGKSGKDAKKNLKRPNGTPQRCSSSGRSAPCKRSRFVPIQPKQT